MPNGQGETAADYAWDAARRGQDAARSADARIAQLERFMISKGLFSAEELLAFRQAERNAR